MHEPARVGQVYSLSDSTMRFASSKRACFMGPSYEGFFAIKRCFSRKKKKNRLYDILREPKAPNFHGKNFK